MMAAAGNNDMSNSSSGAVDNDPELPQDVPFTPLVVPLCQQILYKTIGDCGVMWWDVAILIPNIIFLVFLAYGSRKAVRKLKASSSPIFTAFYGLVIAVCLISVLRCIVSMSVNAAVEAGDLADKLLWLFLRFALLATEMSVVIFGLAFGHLDSKTSIQRVLWVTFTIALLYSSIQGTLELVTSHPEFQGKTGTSGDNSTYISYDLFAQGGMIFLMTTSLIFFVVYSGIVLLPFTQLRERFLLPTKRSFYYYSGFLAALNLCQSLASLLLYIQIDESLCVIDVTTYIYFCFYNPLVYAVFLWNFFRVSGAGVHFSYKHYLGDDDASSSTGAASPGLDEDQLSLPAASSSSYFTTSPHKRTTDAVNMGGRGGFTTGGHLSPYYSIDSTHLDFSPTDEAGSSSAGGGNDPYRANINGDLYTQVAVSPPV